MASSTGPLQPPPRRGDGSSRTRLVEELDKARQSNEIIATPLERRRNRRAESVQFWPD